MFFNICSIYNSIEGASGIITATDITSVAAFANLFKLPTGTPITTSLRTIIKTDANITVRFNGASNPGISIAANAQMEIDWLEISSIFVTAAGSANLKIIVAR